MRRNENIPAIRACAGVPALLLGTLVWLFLSIAGMADGGFASQARGVLLPASAEWGMSVGLSVLLNMLLCCGCAFGLWLLNKTYHLLPGYLFTSLFMLTSGCLPQQWQGLSESLIVCAIALICTYMLYGLYGRRNATYGCMLIFSTLSWGSMVQSGCLMLMPVFLAGTIFLQVLRPRELMASLLGVAWPYWLMLGSGLVSFDDLTWPEFIFINHIPGDPQQLVWPLVSAGVASGLFVMLMLYNALNAMPAGVRMRAFNSFINLLGFGCIVLMLIDSGAFTAYLSTLLLCLSQVACRTFSISRSPRAWIFPASLGALFILLYFMF